MKKTITLGLAAIGLLATPVAALAEIVMGNASASVQVALDITETTPLSFGTFLSNGEAGTVTIDKNTDATTVTGVTKINDGARGVFLLSGAGFQTVNISGDTSVTLNNQTGGGGEQMTATLDYSETSLELSPTGTANLLIGGVLTVAANQAIGNYTGTYQFNANY